MMIGKGYNELYCAIIVIHSLTQRVASLFLVSFKWGFIPNYCNFTQLGV